MQQVSNHHHNRYHHHHRRQQQQQQQQQQHQHQPHKFHSCSIITAASSSTCVTSSLKSREIWASALLKGKLKLHPTPRHATMNDCYCVDFLHDFV
ncbi:hypothetical protein E2C01_101373 [Portunus trituberculatus]|uniref:Uncharacterized protein n=1 Tax=Portunus trituberculatus TaxID=210409 RepID=A0A5B7K9F8_PORTR|nr:hypothetical protein [Portunus trituberculatus]